MQLNLWALTGVGLVVAVTYYLRFRRSRHPVSTGNFGLARRTVRSRRNAAAIAGEYTSAASFLGVAGLVLADGADALWFPIGLTAGFLVLMMFVAAPLRRSGAYTLPDFLEERLGSASLRTVSAVFVVAIGLIYLFPQLQGARLALGAVMAPAPQWVAPVCVAAFVIVNVVGGGMRAITLVQAFHYWLKLFALAVPTFVLCIVFLGTGGRTPSGSLGSPAPPEFSEETEVSIETDVTLRVAALTPVRVSDAGPGTTVWVPGVDYPVEEGTELVFPAGAKVPVVSDAALDNPSWLRPGGDASDLVSTYSLIIATFLGTMGLPHVVARFYTNPDGKAARRSAAHVLLLLGLFYLFPILLGMLSRLYVPTLLVTGQTDAAVLELPTAMLPGVAGQIVVAVLAAGAFTAFLSTSSGLLASIAGVLTVDVLSGKDRDFRAAAVCLAVLPVVGAALLPVDNLALTVGLAFAFAASTFCPLLVLGIWWRGLTWPGALAGMCVGGALVAVMVVLAVATASTGAAVPWFVARPAVFTVPVAFFVTIVVSLGTAHRAPEDVNAVMLRMHAPDPLGFTKDRGARRFGRAEERLRLRRGRHRK